MFVVAPIPPQFLQSDFAECGELCRDSRMTSQGMGELGFVDAIAGMVGSIGNYFAVKEQVKAVKKQVSLQAQALKAQKENDARTFALTQAQLQALPYEAQRNTQIYTLYAIGGAAAIVSGIFILAAVRSR